LIIVPKIGKGSPFHMLPLLEARAKAKELIRKSDFTQPDKVDLTTVNTQKELASLAGVGAGTIHRVKRVYRSWP
jgi:hypothetical protein